MCIICYLGVQLIPWPCNMWQLLPRRSRRKRGRHRLTVRVVTVPIIIFSRLPVAVPSTRSGDSSRLIPCFILREKDPLLLLYFSNSLCPPHEWGEARVAVAVGGVDRLQRSPLPGEKRRQKLRQLNAVTANKLPTLTSSLRSPKLGRLWGVRRIGKTGTLTFPHLSGGFAV